MEMPWKNRYFRVNSLFLRTTEIKATIQKRIIKVNLDEIYYQWKRKEFELKKLKRKMKSIEWKQKEFKLNKLNRKRKKLSEVFWKSEPTRKEIEVESPQQNIEIIFNEMSDFLFEQKQEEFELKRLERAMKNRAVVNTDIVEKKPPLEIPDPNSSPWVQLFTTVTVTLTTGEDKIVDGGEYHGPAEKAAEFLFSSAYRATISHAIQDANLGPYSEIQLEIKHKKN